MIGDEEGQPAAAGRDGIVYLAQGPGRRLRVLQRRSKTDSTYRAGGAWFTVGDIGYLDEDGWLFLTDRSANLIISGGVNIYPAEVDEVLLTHPAVADAAAIGVPSEEWGEEVKAVVEAKPGHRGRRRARPASWSPTAREPPRPLQVPAPVDFVGTGCRARTTARSPRSAFGTATGRGVGPGAASSKPSRSAPGSR